MHVIQPIAQTLCALLLIAGVTVNFSNVIGRYLFSHPLSWAEDFMVYTNIWLILLGAALASFQSRHLSMDLANNMLSVSILRVMLIIVTFISAAACGITAWISWQFVARMIGSGQRSISLDVPMYFPHAAVVVGFVLMTLGLVSALHQQLFRSAAAPDGGPKENSLL